MSGPGVGHATHFAEIDVQGPDAADLLEYICVAKVGGDTPVGKGVYTHFLDAKGGVRADLTVLRLGQDHYRVVDGADAGHRDLTWIRRMAQDRGANVKVTDTTTQYGCLALWDALHALGVTPVGVETYANSRRMEKSLRLQNADLLTEYNLFECDLARPKLKAADFHGKQAHLKFRERVHQPATLCTLMMTHNIDSTGVARYPLGNLPVMDPATGATLIDAQGRRSYTTSIAFGPTIGKNIALAYLPHAYCEVGRELQIQYFGDVYPVQVVAVGYRPLYDAENVKPRS